MNPDPPDPADWERVSEVFDYALALPPDERTAYLEAACGHDPALRREVVSLLESVDEADHFFAGLGDEVVQPSLAAVAEGRPLTPGNRLAHYEIQQLIGRGGMGVVYLARDTKLDRPTALKLLPSRLAGSADVRARFIREAQAASVLDHPHICTIYSIEETGDGRLFIAMAYYAGETLQERLERGPLAVDEALGIARQMATGLQTAHAHGIVHRDLKPANVMLAQHEASQAPTVKLLDFGIAKLLAAANLTRTGAIPGTVAYMAPEQARSEPVDARADLWSLGVVLYEMLTGTPPFDGDTEAAILYAVLERDPAPVRDLAPEVPAAVGAIVARLLQRNPEARYPDVATFLAALRALPAPDAPEEPASFTRWHRSAKTMAAVLAVLILLLVGRELVQGWEHPPPVATEYATIAVLPFMVRGAGDLAYLEEGLVDLLSMKLGDAPSLHTVDPNALISHMNEQGRTTLGPAQGRAVARHFGATHFVLGRVVQIGPKLELYATLYDQTGTSQAAVSAMADTLDVLLDGLDHLAQQLLASQFDQPAEQLSGLAAYTTSSYPALLAYLNGERALRENRFAEAIRILQQAVRVDSTFALAWYRLARATGWTGDLEQNRYAIEQALRYRAALPERTRMMIQGYHAFRYGDPHVAERTYRALVTTYPHDAETWQLLAEALYHNNSYYGRGTAEAYDPLMRALSFAPHNRELLVHMMEIAAREKRLETLDTLSAYYLSPTADHNPVPMRLAYTLLRVHALQPDSIDTVVDQLTAAGPEELHRALTRITPILHDLDLSTTLAERLATPAHSPNWRTSGFLHQALIAAARGQWSRVDQALVDAQSLDPHQALIYRALLYTLPFAPVLEQRLAAVQQDVAAWTPPHALADGTHAGELNAIRIYILALLSLQLDDPIATQDYAMSLRHQATADPQDGSFATSLAATLEALLAWHAGDSEATLAHLDAAQRALPFPIRESSLFYSQHLNRFVRAEALFAQGHYDEALSWYATLHDGYFHWGLPLLGPSLERCAQAYDYLGDPKQARFFYEQFIDLWHNADPLLQARTETARQRVAALQAESA